MAKNLATDAELIERAIENAGPDVPNVLRSGRLAVRRRDIGLDYNAETLDRALEVARGLV